MSACPGNVCGLDKTEIVLTGPSTSVQGNYAWSIIYDVRTLNMSLRRTKPTILQCMYDQQRLRSVCASTHYIKQASWIALSPQTVHTVSGITLDRALAPMTLFIFHCRSEISAVRRIDAPKISMPRKKIIGAPGKGWIRFLVRFGSTRKRLSR